jgi:hypothetical protein
MTLLAIITDDPVTRWAGVAGIAVGLAQIGMAAVRHRRQRDDVR